MLGLEEIIKGRLDQLEAQIERWEGIKEKPNLSSLEDLEAAAKLIECRARRTEASKILAELVDNGYVNPEEDDETG